MVDIGDMVSLGTDANDYTGETDDILKEHYQDERQQDEKQQAENVIMIHGAALLTIKK